MSIVLNDNIQNNSPKALDNKSGVFEAGAWRPYLSVNEAVNAIPKPIRHIGLVVNIMIFGQNAPYWFKNGTEDNDLVPMVAEVDLSNYYDKSESDGRYIFASPLNRQTADIKITGKISTQDRIQLGGIDGNVLDFFADADLIGPSAHIQNTVGGDIKLKAYFVDFTDTIATKIKVRTLDSEPTRVLTIDEVTGEIKYTSGFAPVSPSGDYIYASPNTPQNKFINLSDYIKTSTRLLVGSGDGASLNPLLEIAKAGYSSVPYLGIYGGAMTGGAPYVDIFGGDADTENYDLLRIRNASGDKFKFNNNGSFSLKITPTLDTIPTQVLTRDSVTGEVKYVPSSSFGGGGSSYAFINGLTESGGVVKLGGSLNDYTAISTNGNTLFLGSDYNNISIQDQEISTMVSPLNNPSIYGINRITASNGGLGDYVESTQQLSNGTGVMSISANSVSTPWTILDDIFNKGLFYGADYSIGRTFPADNLWIPNAGWVNSQLEGYAKLVGGNSFDGTQIINNGGLGVNDDISGTGVYITPNNVQIYDINNDAESVEITKNYFAYKYNSYVSSIRTEPLTANRGIIFQDKSGTVALLSDITGGNFISNQNTSAQDADAWIDGTFKVSALANALSTLSGDSLVFDKTGDYNKTTITRGSIILNSLGGNVGVTNGTKYTSQTATSFEVHDDTSGEYNYTAWNYGRISNKGALASLYIDMPAPTVATNYTIAFPQNTSGTVVLSVNGNTPNSAGNISLMGFAQSVSGADFEITDATKGIILTAPNGSRWRQTISNTGEPTWTQI